MPYHLRPPQAAAIYSHYFPALSGIQITCGIISQREMRLMRHDARKPRNDLDLVILFGKGYFLYEKQLVLYILEETNFRTNNSAISFTKGF